MCIYIYMYKRLGVGRKTRRHQKRKWVTRKADGKLTFLVNLGGVLARTCHFRKNVQLPCLQKDLCTESISRDFVNFPSELCRRRSGMFTEVACLMPPDKVFDC